MERRLYKKMTTINEVLALRKSMKAKKPNFIRQDTNKKSKLNKGWKKPKGLHSKLRLHLKGRPKKVSVGYRSPKKIRYFHKSGLEQKLIKSKKDLEKLDSKKHGLVIASSIGNKSRVDIMKKALEGDFKVLNFKNPKEHIEGIEQEMISRKKIRKDAGSKDKKSKENAEEKRLADKVSEEGQKELEKKNKDKILTKKEK
jgi:large subunit ribosomal protein L32e